MLQGFQRKKEWGKLLENLFWVGLVGALIALIFALTQAKKVLKFSEGTELMQKLAASIRKGANAYLKRQYTTVAKIFIIVFVILLILAGVGMLDNWFIPFAFLTGGIWSGLAGFVGMKIATSANARTANAAHESLNRGLNVAFSSGAVMGFTVVGLGLLDVSIWFHILKYIAGFEAAQIAQTMVMFGMGASFMALFGRVGGGIFTKAADVGADLVGKVEAGIPEDDPRNPATIADNVGDNVGDVAGMGADLYESYVGSILATFALGASAYAADGLTWNAMLLPLIIAVVGVVCSVIGTFLIRMRVIPQAQEIIKINGRLIFRIHLDRRIKDNQTLQILRVLLYLESVIILQLLTHEQRADLSVIDDVLDLSRRIRRVHRDGNHPVTIRTEVRI